MLKGINQDKTKEARDLESSILAFMERTGGIPRSKTDGTEGGRKKLPEHGAAAAAAGQDAIILAQFHEEAKRSKKPRVTSDTEVETGNGRFRTPPRQRAARAAAAAAGKNGTGKS